MRKILILSLIILTTVISQAQTNPSSGNNSLPPLTPQQQAAFDEIIKLSGKLGSLFNTNRFDEALSVAEKAVKLAEDNGLFEKDRAVSTLVNLAEIQFAKDRDRIAAGIYERVVSIYEKSSTMNNSLSLAKAIERLAFLQGNGKNYERAEENYLKALHLREKIYGSESAELIDTLISLGDFIRYKGQPGKAEQYYQRAVRISDQTFKPDDKRYGAAFSSYQCFIYQWKGTEGGDSYLSKFSRNVKHPRPEKPQDKTTGAGVVNSKALKLVQPDYPYEPKRLRADGVVIVQVIIDETGRVISAETSCGYSVFARPAERAALKSKFTPTLLGGQPVKVTGIIVYNFVGL